MWFLGRKNKKEDNARFAAQVARETVYQFAGYMYAATGTDCLKESLKNGGDYTQLTDAYLQMLRKGFPDKLKAAVDEKDTYWRRQILSAKNDLHDGRPGALERLFKLVE